MPDGALNHRSGLEPRWDEIGIRRPSNATISGSAHTATFTTIASPDIALAGILVRVSEP